MPGDGPPTLAGTVSEEGSREPSARPTRGLSGQRRGRAVFASAILVAALLGVLAYAIAHSQSTSRDDAQKRFQAQATVTASLTHALLGILESESSQQAAKTFSGQISAAQLDLMARKSHDTYVIIMSGSGTVLATSAGAPHGAISKSSQISVALTHAEHGKSWFGDVSRGSMGTSLLVEAVPFSTASGKRIAVIGAPLSVLSNFFSAYLKGALEAASSSGLIVDSTGHALGSSTAMKPGQPVTANLQRALRNPGVQPVSEGGGRYVASAPIGTSTWRVIMTEPGSALYPPLIGSQRWILWLVFAAVALAGMLAVFLLARVLAGAERVSTQAEVIQRANDALAKANAELDAFSYSVSHDLRAPLRAIDGFSRILIEEAMAELSEEHQRYLGLVRANTQKMGELIDDLLSLSRVGSHALARQTVDVNSLVAEVHASFTDEIADREVEITIGDLPEVQADRALLRQVFQNLMSNALKYSRDESPARVSVIAEHNGDEAVFTVRDNGVGFDMRYASKLFEVFQRLHRAEDYEGTGVGLAIVARIVSRHGGRIWAESSPGEGAAFHFTLGADAT